MAHTDPFKVFIDLIKFDQRFHSLNAQIRKYEQELTKIQEQLQQELAVDAQFKLRVREAQKRVDEFELKMQELNQAEKDKKERLELVANEKEYAAIKKEIALLQQEQIGHEKNLLDAWNKLETAKKEYQLHHEQSEEKRAQLSVSCDEKSQKLQEFQAQHAQETGERKNKQEHIPQEWLEKYSVMRERVIDPVMPVIRESCSACFYAIPPQDIVSLKQHKLVQCKDCYRLLYLEDPEKVVKVSA